MSDRINGIRRLFVGTEVGLILSVLLAGTLFVSGGFVPAYLAVLFASGVRNVYLAWLGSGVLFYAVAFVFLYLEAVTLTALYFGLQYVYRSLHNRPTSESST